MKAEPQSKRAQASTAEMWRRLQDNPDFQEYLALLDQTLAAYYRTLPMVLVGPEDVAMHNQRVGGITALQKARGLVQNMIDTLDKEAADAARH